MSDGRIQLTGDDEGHIKTHDGSVVLARASQVLGQLYGQVEVAESFEVRPGPDLSENIRALSLWQLQAIIDEVSHQKRDLDGIARRLGLVEVMIREQASSVMNHDPMAAEPVRNREAEEKAAKDVAWQLRNRL